MKRGYLTVRLPVNSRNPWEVLTDSLTLASESIKPLSHNIDYVFPVTPCYGVLWRDRTSFFNFTINALPNELKARMFPFEEVRSQWFRTLLRYQMPHFL